MRRASDQCGRANKNNADKTDAAKKIIENNINLRKGTLIESH